MVNLTVNTILLFLSLSFITFSITGYGGLFVKIFFFKKKKYINDSYLAIFGLTFLVFVSYCSNLFFSHSESFNFFIHLVGFFYFIFFLKLKKKIELTKTIFLLIII